MHRRHKALGLFLGAIGIGILIAVIIPSCYLVVIEGVILVIMGWLLLRRC